MSREIPLGEALRALPPPVPQADGWLRVRATLARRRRRRLGGLLALAASLGLVALLVVRTGPEQTNLGIAQAPAGSDGPALEVDALVARSALLEWQLAAVDAGGRSADLVAVDLELVERLQWIDRLLGEPAGQAATRELLWRERVRLLDQRLLLAGDAALIAAAGPPPGIAL
jgi:hypothetical protein